MDPYFQFDNNDVSDEELDDRAELPDTFYEEEKYYSDIRVINNFKNLMEKEPEFIGIKNVPAKDIYNIIYTAPSYKTKDLTSDQVGMYNDLYIELFGGIRDIKVYKSVTYQIFKKCYIN